MLTFIFLVILIILTLIKLILHGYYAIHMLQQLGYQNLKFVSWLQGNKYRSTLLWEIFELIFTLFLLTLLYYTTSSVTYYKYITATIMITVFAWKIIHPFIAGWIGKKAKAKKPLVFTPRVLRLFATYIALSLFILIFGVWFLIRPFDEFTLSSWNFLQFNAFILFLSVITTMIVLISNLINMPIEKLIHLFFFLKAKRKIKKATFKKICITGSYGKTSTKFFLYHILKSKYKILYTPSSYNTPMGISKVINNEDDLSIYDYFICEMGADKKGDIEELCKLVPPDYGIISAVDNQHLETFLSIDNIIKTKLALFKNLKADSIAVYNYDSELLKEGVDKYRYEIFSKLFSYSIDENSKESVDVIAKDIENTRRGLSFKVIFKDGEEINVAVPILGKHNVSNLLAAILMARELGLSNNEIRAGLTNVEPVEHRLQLIDSGTGVLVLDDAFNSNLKGATEALNILKEIEGKKKIIITPGIIDLGEESKAINFSFGERIAESVDIVILVGMEQSKSIKDGIVSKGFDEKNLFVVPSLKEAERIMGKVISIGDVVLFENDLPDVLE